MNLKKTNYFFIFVLTVKSKSLNYITLFNTIKINMEKNIENKINNPFKYIIKLSVGKHQIDKSSHNKPKRGFISPIKKRNCSKKLNPQYRNENTSPNHPSNKDLEREIILLKQKLSQKEDELTKAKNQINDLLKENITLKTKVSQYKDKIDNMTSNGNILSKETLIYNYFLGLNSEIINNENAVPNLEEMTYEELLALEDKIGYVNKGYSQAQIDKLPITKYHKATSNEKCVICQFDIEEGNDIKKLNCEHIYHDKCIDEWLLKEKQCPFCKVEVIIP